MDPRFSKNGALPVNVGPINAFPKDRFGNRIHKGMKVIYRPAIDLVFDVLDVKPVLDPRAPTGMVQMVLSVTFPIGANAAQNIMEMIAIGQAAPADPEDLDPVDPPAVTEN